MFAVKHPIMTHLELKCILDTLRQFTGLHNLIDLVQLAVLFYLNLVLDFQLWFRIGVNWYRVIDTTRQQYCAIEVLTLAQPWHLHNSKPRFIYNITLISLISVCIPVFFSLCFQSMFILGCVILTLKQFKSFALLITCSNVKFNLIFLLNFSLKRSL